MGKPLYLHYSLADEAFYDPDTGALRGAFSLIRNDSYTLRTQVVLNRTATVSLATYQASTRTVDLSSYGSAGVFALKTETNFAADGDYTQAWGGYATDASWHSLSNGRFSLNVAPTVTPSTYVAEFQLQASGGAALTLHGAGAAEGRTRCLLARDLAVGDEDTAVSGISVNRGTATILAGNTSVDVAVTGFTTATGEATVSLVDSANFTIITYSKPANGTLRIHSSAAAPAGGWTVSYVVTNL